MTSMLYIGIYEYRWPDLVGRGAVGAVGVVQIFPRYLPLPWLWTSRRQTSRKTNPGSRGGYFLQFFQLPLLSDRVAAAASPSKRNGFHPGKN
jgi:hypothetical protein